MGKVITLHSESFYRKRATEIAISGKRRLVKGDLSGALDDFKYAKKMDPNNLNIIYFHALSLYKKGEYKEVVEILEKVNEGREDEEDFLKLKVAFYFMMKEYDKALESSRRLIQVTPDSEEAHFKMCDILIEKEEFEDAMRLADYLYDTHENKDLALLKRGEILYREGKYDESEWVMKDVLKKVRGVSVPYIVLFDIELKRGNYNNAEGWMREMKECVPEDKDIASKNIKVISKLKKINKE